jgi:hypothetical protein
LGQTGNHLPISFLDWNKSEIQFRIKSYSSHFPF